MPVHKGDVLVIPAPTDSHKTAGNKVSIHWQQSFRQRDADYYLLVAKNKPKATHPDLSNSYYVGNEVPFYIQSDWYNEQGFNSASGMKKIDNDNYELTIDNRHQYAGGDKAQFIVWHDKERKPFADRFLQTGLLKQGTDSRRRS
ncbi:hypothetical protein FRC01_000678 [Tulasnella sp. 417]|nr:hypothetical protein FRC01_000678 [Tulasnella sp. 417]